MIKGKREQIKAFFYIIISLGFINIIPMLLYQLLDNGVYHYVMSAGFETKEEKFQAYMTWYATYDWALFVVEFLLKIAITVFCLRCLLKVSGNTIKTWLPRQKTSQLVIGLILGAAAISVVFLVLVLTENAHVVSWTPNFTIQALQYLLMFVLVGFSEELFYRGLVMKGLDVYKSKSFLIISSSLIFSLIHGMNQEFSLIAFMNIVLIGIIFAYIFIKSGSLWMPIGYHILWNYFQGIVYGFNVSGVTVPGILTTEYKEYNVWNGGGFGPEGGLITTLISLVVLGVVVWYFRSKPPVRCI